MMKKFLAALKKKLIPPEDSEAISKVSHPDIKRIVWGASLVLIIFLGLFLLWAIFAPIDEAVMAPGKVSVVSTKKTIQHLEGGIISQILVQDGQSVQAGQVLVILDDTQSKASRDLLLQRRNELLAQQGRLLAERDNASTIQFDKVLLEAPSSQSVEAMAAQQRLFQIRHDTLQSNLDILKSQIRQAQNEIRSFKSQSQSFDSQLKLIDEEEKAVAYLEKKKLIERSRLLALRREHARLVGDRDEKIAQIAEKEQQINEIKIRILGIQNQFRRDTLSDLQELQQKLIDASERYKSAEDIVTRTQIIAPRTGKIINLQVHTIGGVVRPGEALMDLVPTHDELVIEARVRPQDIEQVQVGLLAKVKFLPFKQRSVPWLNGKVTRVSADSLEDQRTNQAYYAVQIAIPPQELARLRELKLEPGMPAQVSIVSRQRNLVDYLLTPIQDSFKRAFLER